MPGDKSRQNGKLGGRPKGTKTAATLDKEAARGAYQQWMTRKFDLVMSSQFTTATGISQFVYRDAGGRFKVIDDPDELRAKVEEGAAIEIFTRLPNAQAQSDILNRIMDKPKEQPQEFEHKGKLVVEWGAPKAREAD